MGSKEKEKARHDHRWTGRARVRLELALEMRVLGKRTHANPQTGAAVAARTNAACRVTPNWCHPLR